MSTTPTTPDELVHAVSTRLPTLPDAQRRAALYLINHYARVPFMTATEFAAAAGTSQSSITRLILGLGFQSYASFTEVVGAIVLGEINETLPTERFARAQGETGLADLIANEIRHMTGLQQVLRSDGFQRSIMQLNAAQRVVISGFGAASSIAVHTHLYLSRIRPDVTLITDLSAPAVTYLEHLGVRDCALMFAVPRYVRDAQTLLTFFKRRRIPSILVSERTSTDLAHLATELMIVPITNGPTTAMPSAMFTIGSLIVEGLALLHPEQTMPSLNTFEDAATDTNLFIHDQPRSKDVWQAKLDDYTGMEVTTD